MGRPHMRGFMDGRTKDRLAEFAEVVHFRDPGKAADMPKLDDRWNLGLWLGNSSGWNIGRSAPVWIHLEAPRESTMEQKVVD